MSNAPQSNITNEHVTEATEWLAQDRLTKEAKERLGELKETLVGDIAEDEGAHLVIVTPIGNVQVLDKERRSFDADKLSRLVPDDVFEIVTKVVVDPTAFDKAVDDGLISAKTVSKVTDSTEYVEVREYTAPIV